MLVSCSAQSPQRQTSKAKLCFQQKKLDHFRLESFYFSSLAVLWPLPPFPRGCSEVFHRPQGQKKNVRHIRYRCVFVCARFYSIGPRRRLYECWLPRRGRAPQLLWLPVCVCLCSVPRSLTVFANHCADSACRVYVMCGLRTQRSHAHPEN